jgi:hypothetical protein
MMYSESVVVSAGAGLVPASPPHTPLHPLPQAITDPDRLDHVDSSGRDRRRHPPRTPTRRLSCTNDIFGSYMLDCGAVKG